MLTGVVRRTGESYDIERTASLTLRAVIIVAPATLVAGFVLALLYDPLFMVVIIAPLIVYMAPNVSCG